jgi:copper chaperone CopZ
VVAAAAFPSISSAILRISQSGSIVADGSSAVLRVKIPSMDCAACALNIQSVLKRQPGVVQAQVSFVTKEAVVRYHAAKFSADKIIAAIDQTGFKAEPVTGLRKE